MIDFQENINRVCSFYVSDWHLVTMLLPHINKSINEEIKITTILEQDSEDKVKTLVNKLNLKNTRQILRINWGKTEMPEEKIKAIFSNKMEENLEIIVAGSIEYINETNRLINEYVINKNIKAEIKIVNCYSVEDKLDIQDILENHGAVLNTAGEKSIEEYLKKVEIKK